MKQFKDKALMVPEIALIEHSNYIMLVIWVFLHDIVEVLSFFMRKFVVHFGVSSDFNCENGFVLEHMISAFHYLCE